MIEIDLSEVGKFIQEQMDEKCNAIVKFKNLLEFCRAKIRSPEWDDICRIDWNNGIQELKQYCSSSMQVIPSDINAIYVGIGNYVGLDGIPATDFEMSGSRKFVKFDDEIEWALDLN